MKKIILLALLLTAFLGTPKSFAQAEPFLGQIAMVGFDFAPRGWAMCDGQLLSIAQNTALFTLLGTTYGGDGQTTFALPNLRGRVALHPGQGITLGQMGGTANITLTTSNLPSHSHSVNASTEAGTSSVATGNVMADTSVLDKEYTTISNTTMSPTGNTGGNQPINNMQPYLGVYYIIALQGIFPLRY